MGDHHLFGLNKHIHGCFYICILISYFNSEFENKYSNGKESCAQINHPTISN